MLSGLLNVRSYQVRVYGELDLDARSNMPDSLLLVASRKTGRREERSEAFSAARDLPLGRLDARSGCEAQFKTKPGRSHSIYLCASQKPTCPEFNGLRA